VFVGTALRGIVLFGDGRRGEDGLLEAWC
jgi:hypothetical protein